MKKYLTLKNFIRAAVLVLDVILLLFIAKSYRTDRRSEVRRVNKLKNELQEEITAQTVESTVTDVEEVVEVVLPTTYSVRGDSFKIENGATGTDYPALLEQTMLDAGCIGSVSDYTIDLPGSLADLYYAGVSNDVINDFIDKNKEKDINGVFGPVEINLGNTYTLRLARNDRDSIPIIFIGYSGGYGQDPQELIEQQKAILATYSQQQYFLIVGTHPMNCADTEAFDKAMTDYWGNHYLNVSSKVPQYSLNTEEGHQAIAEAIFKKLKKLGLVTLNTQLSANTYHFE